MKQCFKEFQIFKKKKKSRKAADLKRKNQLIRLLRHIISDLDTRLQSAWIAKVIMFLLGA